MSGAISDIATGGLINPVVGQLGAAGQIAQDGIGGLGLGDLGGLFGKGPAGQIPGSVFKMDPTAAGIYQGQLGDYKNMLSQYQGGASSPYVQSMLAPAYQQNAQTLGDVTQQQGLRGIRGSSFGEASLGNLASQANQNIANISGQAQYNQLQQQRGIMGDITGIGGAYQAQGNTALQAYLQQAAQAQKAQQANAGMFGGLLGGIGGFMLGGPAGAAVGSGLGSSVGQGALAGQSGGNIY